jgi:Signal peptidase (SPase) II
MSSRSPSPELRAPATRYCDSAGVSCRDPASSYFLGVSRTFALLLGAATIVATLDLGHKAASISERGGVVLAHDRSAFYVAGVAAASVVWAWAVSRTGSSSIALAGGVVLGGAAGNLVSIALWPSLRGVPDPIVTGSVAFNLADVAVGIGFVLLLPATAVFAYQNRKRLFEPV